MLEERIPITLEEAVNRVVSRSQKTETERIPLEQADFRYLAEDIRADHDVPMFDRSMYDGFAVRADDTRQASQHSPVRLKVIESIPAGREASHPLLPGTAMRIMTGAKVPPGADAIVMLEDVREGQHDDGAYIELFSPVPKGQHISFKGEDIAKGSVLLQKGRRIGPGEKAILATFGYDQVTVFKRPVVGVLATGSELLSVDAPMVSGKIRNSNSYMLQAQLMKLGADVKLLGIINDDFESSLNAIVTSWQDVDYLITTGGASVGDYDFVQRIIKRIGAELLFNKVAMRPGSVTTVAVKENKWLFGLSGNPSACFIGLELFVRPVLKKAVGSGQLYLPQRSARLNVELTSDNPFVRLLRARVEIKGEQALVHPVGLDKSGAISGLLEANCLLVIPSGRHHFHKGDQVTVIMLEGEE
jgi:molybdopterin molybdotransferase